MNLIKEKWKGILLAIAIMLIAKTLSPYLPAFGTALTALLIGVLVRQFTPNFHGFQAGVIWSEKYFLETAIVFIGFGFQLSQIASIGVKTISFVILSVVLVLGFALLLQKLFRHKGNLFLLLGAGSAICGSSAIGATAPLLKAKEEETGISLAVINFLGLAAMLLLPLIASFLHFSDTETAVFLGGILQSMGNVVGASYAINPEVGQAATLVKMFRIALLVPILFVIYFWFRKKAAKTTAKVRFPIFILLFALTAILSQLHIIPAEILKGFSKTGDVLLNTAMAAIGLKIHLKNLWDVSGKAFFIGSLIFVFQIILYVLFIAVAS